MEINSAFKKIQKVLLAKKMQPSALIRIYDPHHLINVCKYFLITFYKLNKALQCMNYGALIHA